MTRQLADIATSFYTATQQTNNIDKHLEEPL